LLDKVIEWLAMKSENGEDLSDERVISLALIIIKDCPEYEKVNIDGRIKLLDKVVSYINSLKVKVEMREM
jgi:hypothetical protein